MHLQDIFYLLGIIMMSLAIFFLLGMVVLLFYVKKIIHDVANNIEKKINQVSNAVSHSGEIATDIGMSLVNGAVKGIAGMARKRRK